MRIALDGLPLCQVLTGIGHYTFELAQHLAFVEPQHRIDLVSPRSFVPSLQPSRFSKNLKLQKATKNPILRYWWTTALPRYLKRNQVAVFHGTNYELPQRANCATVVTIHDLSTLLLPNTHEPQNAARAKKRLPGIAASATMVITPTECVRREINAQLSVPLDRIAAIPEAARPLEKDQSITIKKRFGISDEFLLYAGTVEPRKNLKTLVEAFEQLPERHERVQLVIAGKKGWMVDDLYEYVRNLRVRDRIIFAGYVNDSELSWLYSSCKAFVYPSIYEGFGLPPLEAMAAAAPVIASNIQSIKEVVGDSAYLVEPTVPYLAAAIVKFMDNPELRDRFSALGKKCAAMYSWSQTARRVLEVYEEARARYVFAANKRG